MTTAPAPAPGAAGPAPAPVSAGSAGSAPSLLDVVREQAAVEAQAARRKLQAVVAWAAAHPGPGEPDLPAGALYADREVLLAGPGAPGVSQFAIADLATAWGKSTASTRRYVGDALELGYRLPRIWARLVKGDLEEWKARSIAQRTKHLAAPAAAWVDAQVAARAHRVGPRELEGLVGEAIVVFDPDHHVETTLTPTYVHITPTDTTTAGLGDYAYLDACLPLPEALALEQAIAATAQHLITDYPDHTRDERRALALGHLADHTTSSATDNNAATGDAGRGVARQLSLVVHLDQGALKDAALARVHTATGAQHLVSVESVATWCLQPGTKVTLRPVIDLATPITCPGYVPSPALRAQVAMLSPTCAFPYCTIPVERCDDDHITPYADGGTTDTWNLAPLCRFHHRLKTFGAWTYHQPHLGTYHWTSPQGHHYRRDRHGTTDCGGGDPSPRTEDATAFLRGRTAAEGPDGQEACALRNTSPPPRVTDNS